MDIVDHDKQRLIDFVLMIKNLLERDHPQVRKKLITYWEKLMSKQTYELMNVQTSTIDECTNRGAYGYTN